MKKQLIKKEIRIVPFFPLIIVGMILIAIASNNPIHSRLFLSGAIFLGLFWVKNSQSPKKQQK